MRSQRRAGGEADLVPILTIAAYKGGVGKTTLALELAYLLDAVLVDLDWDDGGASRRWGYRHTQRVDPHSITTPIDKARTPRVLAGRAKADLVLMDPDLNIHDYDADTITDALETWAGEWGREWVVVDTHPGNNAITAGAMAAAHTVLVPSPLAVGELDGLEGLLRETANFRLLLVPNKVRRSPAMTTLKRLAALADDHNVPVGPAVSLYPSLETRQQKMAVSAISPTPARWDKYVQELHEVADEVKRMAK